jgi:dolichyl-phosphate-mannose--protein O-mannosyl transferase
MAGVSTADDGDELTFPPAPAAPSTRDTLMLKLFGARRLALGTTPRDRLWAWLGPTLLGVLAAVIRLWRLGVPHVLVFDETYYVKYAYSLGKVGYEAQWPSNPNPSFESGHADIFIHKPDFVVHPPLGSWMIDLGIRAFGVENSWSWRIMSATVGIIAVVLVAWIARRIFASTIVGLIAGLFMAVDGEAIVHSRVALLDNFVMFWGLVAFCFLILDREQARRRMATRVAAILDNGGTIGRYGPRLGWRWYRFAAAVSLGLMCGTKWSGIYYLAVFGILTVAWDATARRAVGVKRWWEDAIIADGISAFFVMIPTAVVTYLACWWGWFRNPSSYMHDWAAQNPHQGVSWLPPLLRSFWEYHKEMWTFNTTLHTPHPYQANPLGWIVQWRPTSFYYQSSPKGQNGCTSSSCSSAITSLGNPVLWWAGAVCLAIALVWLCVARDWRAGAVLSGVVAGWLPWFQYMGRTIFTFYSIAFTPWVMMAVAFVIGLALEQTTAGTPARRRVAIGTGVFVAIVLLVSVFFYPIWTAMQVPYSFWHAHMWMPNWI